MNYRDIFYANKMSIVVNQLWKRIILVMSEVIKITNYQKALKYDKYIVLSIENCRKTS